MRSVSSFPSRARIAIACAVVLVASCKRDKRDEREAPSDPLGEAIDLGGVTVRPPARWDVQKRDTMGYWVANGPGGGMSFTAYRRSPKATLEQVRDEQVASLRASASFMSDAGVRAQREAVLAGYPALVCDLTPVGRHVYLRTEEHFVVVTCRGADDLCEKVAASVRAPSPSPSNRPPAPARSAP